VEGFFEGMVELFDADLKRKGFDDIALAAGSYELACGTPAAVGAGKQTAPSWTPGRAAPNRGRRTTWPRRA